MIESNLGSLRDGNPYNECSKPQFRESQSPKGTLYPIDWEDCRHLHRHKQNWNLGAGVVQRKKLGHISDSRVCRTPQLSAVGLKNQSQCVIIYFLKYSNISIIFIQIFLVIHFIHSRQQWSKPLLPCGIPYAFLWIKPLATVFCLDLISGPEQYLVIWHLFCINSKQPQFGSESVSNYSQIILEVSLQEEDNNELK